MSSVEVKDGPRTATVTIDGQVAGSISSGEDGVFFYPFGKMKYSLRDIDKIYEAATDWVLKNNKKT